MVLGSKADHLLLQLIFQFLEEIDPDFLVKSIDKLLNDY